MRRLTLIASLLCLCISGSPSWAQTETSTAQSAEQNVSDLLANVSTIAEHLQQTLTDLQHDIEASRESIQKGEQILDGMLAAVQDVHKNLAEESEIWNKLGNLLGQWESERTKMLTLSESDLRFKEIADAWSDRIATATQLRNQILEQRAESLALLDSIESDRDFVLAWYKVGAADKAIESMQQISTQLASLNQNMQSIVDTTKRVATPTGVTQ